MLKKVAVSQLKVGMFIDDLDCGWMKHPFIRSRFLLKTEEEIAKIRNIGVRGVVIDCGKGLDAENALTLVQAKAAIEAEIIEIGSRATMATPASLVDELQRAALIRKQAIALVRTVIADARLGKAVELDKVALIVERIVESILHNPGALPGLLHIKDKDDYTFMHSSASRHCWSRSVIQAVWGRKRPTRPAWAVCCMIRAKR